LVLIGVFALLECGVGDLVQHVRTTVAAADMGQ